MTVEEWSGWRNPWSFLISTLEAGATVKASFTERKLRLFAVACCRTTRSLWQHNIVATAVDAAEVYADSAPSSDRRLFRPIRKQLFEVYPRFNPANEALLACDVMSKKSMAAATGTSLCAAVMLGGYDDRGRELEHFKQAPLLRDILGHPYRQVYFDPDWRTSDVVGLANAMYIARDFCPMPALADALEEAGCNDPAILAHCRDPNGSHVRGCWVVDLVLGKT